MEFFSALRLKLRHIKAKKAVKRCDLSWIFYVPGYCHSSSISLESLCASIESDSPLFFIFRTTSGNVFLQKDTEACPFRNIEYAFSYSTRNGAKVCSEPHSKLDTCIQEHRMVFQFQACPDVPGSERSGEDDFFSGRKIVEH